MILESDSTYGCVVCAYPIISEVDVDIVVASNQNAVIVQAAKLLEINNIIPFVIYNSKCF